MPKIPGINHLEVVRALEKAGFAIAHQGKHIVMSDGTRIVTIPRHNPVNAFTLGGLVRDAGLTAEQFRMLLWFPRLVFTPPARQPMGRRGFGAEAVSRRQGPVDQVDALAKPTPSNNPNVPSYISAALVESALLPSGTTITIPCLARVSSTRYAFSR